MKLAERWRRFWSGSYVPHNELHVTRLKASAPVVTPDEVAKLERKWKPAKPIDYEDLPV